MMISQLHTQYIPKRAQSVLYILYPKGTLLMLYYIDPKKHVYVRIRPHRCILRVSGTYRIIIFMCIYICLCVIIYPWVYFIGFSC